MNVDWNESSSRYHALHVWINQRQEERRKAGEPCESTLYEWKSMERERLRLPLVLCQAFEGTLPTVHQQCSRSAPEPVTVPNRLICVLGTDVTECPMLLSLRSTIQEQMAVQQRTQERNPRYTPDLTDESIYQAMASVCCWHIYTTVFKVDPRRESHAIDTSEGYLKDETDRMFWRTTYAHLQAALDDDDEVPV